MKIKTPKGSVIKRYNKVGKKMGDTIYFHLDYLNYFVYHGIIDTLPYYICAELVPDNFDYNIIKYNIKTKDVSFIKSPDFNTSNEPIVGDIYTTKYKDTKSTIKFIKRKKNPQIYHHKWLFVMDEYRGFNVEESKKRSHYWVNKYQDIDYSRIGYQDYWKKVVNE